METINDDDGPEISYGGLARSIFKNLLRRVGSNPVGMYIPHPRTLAKSADRLSGLIEIRDQLKSAQETHTKEKPFAQRSFGMAKQMLPGFIRSSIAGTVVFSTYENMYEIFNVSPYEPMKNNVPVEKSGSLVATGMISAACGALGGIVTSSFVTLWQFINSRIDMNGKYPKLLKSPTVRPPFVGPTMMHLMINASMFSTYEVTKNILFNLSSLVIPENNNYGAMEDEVEYDEEQTKFAKFLSEFQSTKHRYLIYDVASITTAGFLGGLISETVAYYLSPLESGYYRGANNPSGSSRLWQSVKALPSPSLRSITMASIPCSLGFLAYEYGKSEYD